MHKSFPISISLPTSLSCLSIYIYVYIYLFIFGCAVSSLLSAGFLLWCAGATPPCHALASIVGARGLSSCDVGTPWASVVVAHRFISSSSCDLCIGRQILIHRSPHISYLFEDNHSNSVGLISPWF